MFFFKHVLKKHWNWGDIVRPKTVNSLPDVITHTQMSALLEATREQRYQSFFFVTYSMGLRLVEALSLQVQGIDAAQMRIHVRLGENEKDRYVILPQLVLLALRRYWKTHRYPILLFQAGSTTGEQVRASNSISKCGVQRSIKKITTDVGIRTNVTLHTP